MMLAPQHIRTIDTKLSLYEGKPAKYVDVIYAGGERRLHIFYDGNDPDFNGIGPEHDSPDCAHLVIDEDDNLVYLREKGQSLDQWIINQDAGLPDADGHIPYPGDPVNI